MPPAVSRRDDRKRRAAGPVSATASTWGSGPTPLGARGPDARRRGIQRSATSDAGRQPPEGSSRQTQKSLPSGSRILTHSVPASCNGWVLLTRREAGSLVPNFDGHAISDISLPPAGTVLVAQRQLRVWSEPQLTNANDQSKWKNVLPAGSCVRVLATRSGSERLWAEVVPASCS